MKTYSVCVEFMDYIDVEAENPDEAREKAIAIMRSQGGITEWDATADNGREIGE